jgi:hypothetical protein
MLGDIGALHMRPPPWSVIDEKHRQYTEDHNHKRDERGMHALSLHMIGDHGHLA